MDDGIRKWICDDKNDHSFDKWAVHKNEVASSIKPTTGNYLKCIKLKQGIVSKNKKPT